MSYLNYKKRVEKLENDYRYNKLEIRELVSLKYEIKYIESIREEIFKIIVDTLLCVIPILSIVFAMAFSTLQLVQNRIIKIENEVSVLQTQLDNEINKVNNMVTDSDAYKIASIEGKILYKSQEKSEQIISITKLIKGLNCLLIIILFCVITTIIIKTLYILLYKRKYKELLLRLELLSF